MFANNLNVSCDNRVIININSNMQYCEIENKNLIHFIQYSMKTPKGLKSNSKNIDVLL